MTVVVAAAIIDGQPPVLLAAQRSYPPQLAGRWELPGGKVHADETAADALIRECREELGIVVAVGPELPIQATTIDGAATLRVHWAWVRSGRAVPLEHQQLRWLQRHQLDDVEWLAPDLPVIDVIRAQWPGPAALANQ
jgi:8-oxo-dGTP diphosphatase